MNKFELRKKAEQIFKERSKSSLPVKDPLQLIENLQIHQIELELQIKEMQFNQDILENSRNSFMQLFENAPIGYIILNSRGIITNVNQTLCSILDYDKTEMIDVPLFGFVQKEDQSEFLGRYKTFFSQPKGKVIKVRLLKRDDKPMYAELTAVKENYTENLEENGDGDVLLINVVDISYRMKTDKEKLELSEKLEALFSQSAVGISEVSPEGNFIRLNKRFADIIGYEVEELKDKNLEEITHPDDLSLYEEHIKEVISGKKNDFELEKRYIHKDGHSVWIRLYSNLVRNKYGEPDFAIATIVDITDQKSNRIELEEKSQKLALAMKSANEGIWEWDLFTGKVYFNESSLQMLGYDSYFVQTGNWWLEQIHTEDSEKVNKAIDDYLTGKTNDYDVQFRLKRKNGTYCWIHSTGKIIKRDEHNEPRLFTGIHRDISQFVENEEDKNEFEFIIDSIQDSMSVLDTEFVYRRVNNAYEKLYGRSKSDIEGKSVIELMGEDTFNRNVRNHLEKALSGEVVRYQSWFHIGSSDPFYHDVIYSPYFDGHGNVKRIIVTSRDLTQQKLAEERSKKTEHMIEQIYNVSTPIWLINTDFEIERVNRALCELLELKQSDIIGKKCYDVLHGPNCKSDKCLMSLINNGKEIGSYELKINSAAKGKITCLVNAQPVYDENAKLFGIIETFTDVSDLKYAQVLLNSREEEIVSQNEELNAQNSELLKSNNLLELAKKELEKSEKRLKFMSEISLEGIIISENFIVTDVNEAILGMTGYMRENIIGQELVDLFPDGINRDEIREALKQLHQNVNRIAIQRKDGTIFPAESICRDVEIDGKVLRISSIRDLTKQVTIEKQLAQTEQKFHTYIQNAPTGFFVADSRGKYLEANPAACEITGYKEGELLKMELIDLIAESDKHLALEHFKSLNDKEYASGDLRFVHKNGEIRYWNVIGKKISENRYIAFTKDVTDRKRIEEEKAKVEDLLNQVGKIAHIGGWEMDVETGKATWTKGTYDIVEIDYGDAIPGLNEHIDFYLPKYQEMISKKMKSLIEEGKKLEFQAELKTAKGNIKWCQAYGKREMINGRCVKVYGTFQDITSQKLIEKELEQHRENLEKLVQDRTQQIEKQNKDLLAMQKLFTGREFRIKELRDELKELKEKL